MKVLITGCAGFIGSNLTDKLLEKNYQIVGLDNFNNYYEPKVKKGNIKNALANDNFKLYKVDILNYSKIEEIFKNEKPEIVVHLAARAGVRPSIDNPLLYSDVNVQGTINLLKSSVDFKIGKFIFGSSSSVYGSSPRIPFVENDPCTSIISPYGASKRAAEFFVETFYRTYKLNAVILRFFTVYGPRGRPDMAPAIFLKKLMGGEPIQQYGDGSTSRDYTYVDDVVEGITKTMEKDLNFEVINLGNSKPFTLHAFIKILAEVVSKKSRIKKIHKQAGDVNKTWANIDKAHKLLGWRGKIDLDEGLRRYLIWLKKQF